MEIQNQDLRTISEFFLITFRQKFLTMYMRGILVIKMSNDIKQHIKPSHDACNFDTLYFFEQIQSFHVM